MSDVCATPENAKCAEYYTKEQDGLAQEWSGRVWCNPPYGRQVGKWVRKAAECAADVVVMLLPARTDTAWFHDYCLRGGQVYFIRGRIKFGDSTNNAPFPSMIVVFGKTMWGGHFSTPPHTILKGEHSMDIERNFTYHSPHDDQVARYTSIREIAKGLAMFINDHCPASREQSLALTKLEECVMWANAAIARNE